jgi:hypothetical protein
MTLRTWDRIRASEWHKLGTPIEWVRDPVIVIGDEVAQMILDGMKPEFPVCAPPWDDFVIEMQPSPWPLSVSNSETMAEFSGPSTSDFATGVLLSFTNMTDRYKTMPLSARMLEEEGMKLMKAVDEAGGWVVGLEMFADLPGGVLPIYWTALVIGADGAMSPVGTAWSFISQRSVTSPEVDAGREIHVEGKSVHVDGVGDVIGPGDPEWIAVEALMEAGMMVVSMVNCSNVGLDDETPDYPRPERRRLTRKDKPLMSFKRLHIKQHRSHRSDAATEGGDGVAIHIVRGHFKTFTPEKPLLGKYSGTWWWQPSVRGTAPRFSIKDYQVDAEERG